MGRSLTLGHGVDWSCPDDSERLGRAAGDHELHDEHEGLAAVPAGGSTTRGTVGSSITGSTSTSQEGPARQAGRRAGGVDIDM